MIEVSQLTYTYPKAASPTLKGLDFKIAEGEIFGFLGPSGAGKSTCQKILYRIMSGYSGEIRVKGKDLKQWGSDYFARIGVGFELPNHYGKLTAVENLKLFAAFYLQENCIPIPQLLEMVGLEADGNKKIDSYSKGMKMRLNFIRAIQHSPDILFFDEPTSGLDPGNARKIKEHILDLRRQGKTIFITTHDMTTADELCDRVAFIVNGELIVTDEPSSLKLEHGKEVVKVELRNGEFEEFPTLGLGQNTGFLNFIREEEILRIHTQEATLERVFLDVTGKKLSA